MGCHRKHRVGRTESAAECSIERDGKFRLRTSNFRGPLSYQRRKRHRDPVANIHSVALRTIGELRLLLIFLAMEAIVFGKRWKFAVLAVLVTTISTPAQS